MQEFLEELLPKEELKMYENLLNAIEELLDRKLEEKLEEKLDKKLDEKLTARFDVLEGRMDHLEGRMDHLEDRIDSLDKQMKCISLTLENDIRPNIMRVAEGHLDLNRKLDRAMESDSEREELALRVNYLDSEFRKMKECKIVNMP